MTAATYGELVISAVAEAGRGAAALAVTARMDNSGEVVDAYSDVLCAVADHVEYVFGSELYRDLSQWRSDTHVHVATGLWLKELRAMSSAVAIPKEAEHAESGPARHWSRAAKCIRAAQELLSTHIGPLDRWRSPDAWVLDDVDGQRAALANLAEVSGVMTLAGPTLVDRHADHASDRHLSAIRAIRDHHGGARLLSLGLIDLRRGHSSGAETIERLRAASSFDVASSDPMVRTQERLRSVRTQLFHLETRADVGAGVTKDVATALAGAHGHLAVIMRACSASEATETGSLEVAADSSLHTSKAWASIRTDWNVVESPAPAEPMVTETAQALLRDMADVTRGPEGWKAARDIRGSGRRPLAVRQGVRRSLESLAGIASSVEVIAARQAGREQLLGHAQALPREFVTEDLTAVRARLDGKGVTIPARMARHLVDHIGEAAELTREVARQASRPLGAPLVPESPQQALRRGEVARYPTVPSVGGRGARR